MYSSSSTESTSAYDNGIPVSALGFRPTTDSTPESSDFEVQTEAYGSGSASGNNAGTSGAYGTAAIIFIWTSAVPASKLLAEQIQSDARYKDVISVISADSPMVRRYLMYPSAKINVTTVPAFVVKADTQYKVYGPEDAHKVFKIAIEASMTTSREVIDLPLPSTRASSRASSRRSELWNSSVSVAV